MTWPPTDSADVAENRERDQVPAEDRADPAHDPACRRGWLGEDAAGHPIPCLICRPHLRSRG